MSCTWVLVTCLHRQKVSHTFSVKSIHNSDLEPELSGRSRAAPLSSSASTQCAVVVLQPSLCVGFFGLHTSPRWMCITWNSLVQPAFPPVGTAGPMMASCTDILEDLSYHELPWTVLDAECFSCCCLFPPVITRELLLLRHEMFLFLVFCLLGGSCLVW